MSHFSRLHQVINQLVVFVLVTFAWIFFRAESLNKAFIIIKKIFEFDFTFNINQITVEKGPMNFVLSIVALTLLALSYLLPTNLKLRHNVLFLTITTFIIFILGKNGETQFIYFQF